MVAGEEHEGVQEEEEGVHLLAGLIGAHDVQQQRQRQHLGSLLQLP